MDDLFRADALARLATDLLLRAGLTPECAQTTAEVLLEGDLMGHTTHGLALLEPYVRQFESGEWRASGEPTVVAETEVSQTWDGNTLSGPWLVTKAAAWAAGRARIAGLASVVIGRSGHIGCLAAYPRPIAESGQMLVLACSDPANSAVAPFGGTRKLFTPNPLAAGWPSPGGPVLIDVSMSITTNGMTNRLRAEGAKFDHPWLLDSAGQPTNDPEAYFEDGTLQPLGGSEAGHKGYALALLVEALTSGLSGLGRVTGPQNWGASVTVLVLDPARFGGTGAFAAEAGWMATQVAANPAADPARPPRLPGARALRLRAEQLERGVRLHPSVAPALARLAAAAGLPGPEPIGG